MKADGPHAFGPVIHQVAGVLAAHLDVPIEEAARIIRTSARWRDVPVGLVASEMVVLASPGVATK